MANSEFDPSKLFGVDGKDLINMMVFKTCPDPKIKAILQLLQKYGVEPLDGMALMLELRALVSQFPTEATPEAEE